MVNRPYLRFTLIGLGLALLVLLILSPLLDPPASPASWVLSWIIAFSVATLALFARINRWPGVTPPVSRRPCSWD